MWFMFVIPFVIFIVIFLSIAGSMFGSHQKNVESMQTMVEEITRKKMEGLATQTPLDNADHICEYCGSKIAEGEKKCAACGAGVKTKK